MTLPPSIIGINLLNPFNQRISESLLFSYALCQVRSKQEEPKLEVVDKAAKIDEETDVKTQAVKADKTTPYAKSMLAINTWALTIKIKTSNK